MKKKTKKEKIKLIDIKKIRFSPELEIELPKKEDAYKLIKRGRILRGWEIKSDATLNNGIELSPENSNHLFWNKESLMQIQEVLAIVRVHKGFTDKKHCGLHLHVNVRNLKDEEILKIIKEWVHRQKYIVKRFKVHKDRLNDTCKLLPMDEVEKLTEKEIHKTRTTKGYCFDNYGYLDEKYYSLNATHLPNDNYGTLEFRLFTGSVVYREIKEAIYFVLTFIRDSLERD